MTTRLTSVQIYVTAFLFSLIYEAPAFGSTVQSLGLSGIGEYCHGEAFTGGCASDEVIVVQSALYGLMRIGRCIKTSLNRIGCQENVQRQADRMCSGRRTCRIQVSSRSFGSVASCPPNAKLYLEVAYECKKVLTIVSPECNIEKFVMLRSRFGLLSNLIAEERGQGSLACPWRIELPRGERINVTLVDFSTPMADQAGGENRICFQYALVTEKLSTTENRRVCGGDRRESHVYTSRTNTIEVRIITKRNVESDRNFYFLLRYEAIGCSIPQIPRNGWMVRDVDGILMGCNHTGKTWRLYCDGNKWTGQMENCTTNERYDRSIMVWKHVTIPESVVLVVIGSLIIITVIIVALLSLLCIEWSKGKDQSSNRRRRLSGPLPRDLPTTSPPPGKQSQGGGSGQHSTRGSRTRYDSLKPTTPNCSSTSAHCSSSSSNDHPSNAPRGSLSSPGAARENDYYTPEGGQRGQSSPRPSPSSKDYLREMWPMALPPGNLAGGTTLFKTVEASDPSPFQYGDSVTLTTGSSGQGSGSGSGSGHARGASDYDTHIYETPKYLRREKAATLRLKGVKAQRFDSSGDAGAHRCSEQAHSMTLPRELDLTSSVAAAAASVR